MKRFSTISTILAATAFAASAAAITPPYVADFSKTGLEGFTVIDANNDGKTWKTTSGGVCCGYNTKMDMDDWLITPAMQMEGGKIYTVRFNVWSTGAKNPERIEVKCGDAPKVEAMTITYVEPTVIDMEADSPKQITMTFTPLKDVEIYIGLHGISDADRFMLYAGNITFEAPRTSAVPAAVEDFKAEPDLTGAFRAEVSLKAPSTTYAGAELKELEKIELRCNGSLVHTFTNPAPGESLSFSHERENRGKAVYEAVAFSEAGEGMTATVSAYLGFRDPKNTEWVRVERTGVTGEMTVTWAPVTEDIAGLVFPENSVTYYITCRLAGGRDWQIMAQGVEGTTFTFQPLDSDEQAFLQAGVIPAYGDLMSAGRVSEVLPVGLPYAGLDESGAERQHEWWVEGDAMVPWTFCQATEANAVSYDDDGMIFAMMAKNPGEQSTLTSGLVSLAGMTDPQLTFRTYDADPGGYGKDNNTVSVAVRPESAGEWSEIFSSAVGDICKDTPSSWGGATVALKDYAGQTVQVKFTGVTVDYQLVLLDAIKIADDPGSGICAPVAGNLKAEVRGGMIVVSGAEGEEIGIYSVNGETVWTGTGNAQTSVKVLPGAYIVKAGDAALKVLVR